MMSNEVAKDSRLGSLVPLNHLQVILMYPTPHQFMFMLGGCGGLGFSSLVCWWAVYIVSGFHFIIYVAI
jgi:hypothetical protein